MSPLSQTGGKSSGLPSRGIFSKYETVIYAVASLSCGRVWAAGPRTTTSSAGPVEWRRRAALESPEPGSNDAAPVQRPCIAYFCRADRPARAARLAHLPHPRGGWCFTLVWRTSETNLIVAGAAGAPHCQYLGNCDLRMNQHYALLCRTSNYLNTRPNSATAVTNPYLRLTD